ncbi:OLC1v1036603C1 [Oldenlandia corymbosa var. corymbosa]|uniref:OLC1v1036603C1 n=1 Tax=Oldenlandia corymbosa var. corymbosa TaxID=529605 RepID=A0AAV1CX18_OLDCO|nr:OLC1v1036603C1 [Oldenlandia corymbosa var. corymbosa]
MENKPNIAMLHLLIILFLFLSRSHVMVKAVETPSPAPLPQPLGFLPLNVEEDVHTDAQKQHSRSHACSSVRNVVQLAFVFLQALMATSNLALVTITGRPNEAVLNALDFDYLY